MSTLDILRALGYRLIHLELTVHTNSLMNSVISLIQGRIFSSIFNVVIDYHIPGVFLVGKIWLNLLYNNGNLW